jgi:hypothetical protein
MAVRTAWHEFQNDGNKFLNHGIKPDKSWNGSEGYYKSLGAKKINE